MTSGWDGIPGRIIRAGSQGWNEDWQVGNILPFVVEADAQEEMLRRESNVSVPCFEGKEGVGIFESTSCFKKSLKFCLKGIKILRTSKAEGRGLVF